MRENPAFKAFMLGYIPLLLLGIVTVIYIDKGSLVLELNTYHQPNLDFFFKYFTYLGDGLFLCIVILVLFFINRVYALIFLATGVGQLITAAFLKKIVFGRTLRPAIYIGEYLLHFVEGVRVPWWHSFPSGHSITAFSSFFLMAMLTRSKIVAVLGLVISVGVAISRVYLVQHFLEDVVAGSLVGVLLSMFFYSKASKWGYIGRN